MKFITLLATLALVSAPAFAAGKKAKVKKHDIEHNHVKEAGHHDHNEEHHKDHDHEAHHPEHKDIKKGATPAVPPVKKK